MVEAEAAFQLVIRHLEREGVMTGSLDLPPRVRYAIRHCGGLPLFNQRLEEKGYPFLQRDFVKPIDVPLADDMAPQLLEPFGGREAIQRLTAARTIDRPPQPTPPQTSTFRPKPIPAPMTDVQHWERRAVLREQAEMLQQNRGGVARENTHDDRSNIQPSPCRCLNLVYTKSEHAEVRRSFSRNASQNDVFRRHGKLLGPERPN